MSTSLRFPYSSYLPSHTNSVRIFDRGSGFVGPQWKRSEVVVAPIIEALLNDSAVFFEHFFRVVALRWAQGYAASDRLKAIASKTLSVLLWAIGPWRLLGLATMPRGR